MSASTSVDSFAFTIARVAGRVVLTVQGTLDRDGCATLERILRDLVDDQGNMAVVVDLADVAVRRLECAGVLAAAAGSAARRGGEVTVANAPDVISWALEASRSRGHFAVTGGVARPA